jgi:hypothetical protein
MIILDVEASGLGDDSYPIEVAWQHRFIQAKFDSFLIKPEPSWQYWDAYAEEQIHHISRDTLASDGISVVEAASRLNASLRGLTVYTDAPPYDRRWIATLFRTAAIEQSFEIQDVRFFVPPDKEGAYRRRFNMTPVRHRALDDVRQIIKCVNYVAPEG